jgi:Tol biopolymer transport system component
MRKTVVMRLPLVAALVGGALLLGGPGSAQATFTGPTGRIAYSAGQIFPDEDPIPSQIFTVNPDGGDRRQLTQVPDDATAAMPAWSPDGRRIAYQSNVGGSFELWTMNADGSGQARLLADPGHSDNQPSWSPDGRTLVFSRCDATLGFVAYCDLARVGADGRGLRTLLGGKWLHIRPRYSPDGRRIVFSSNRDGLLSAVWTMNAGGGGAKRITGPAIEAFWPDWSPDGRHIVFTNFCCLPRSNVLIMNTDGSGIRTVTRFSPPAQGGFGSYAPSGRKLVLQVSPPDGSESNALWTADVDGSRLTRITDEQLDLVVADWGAAPAPGQER